MKKMKESCIILSITLFIILNIATASADIPQLISVQGRLTDTSDSPITTPTSYTFNIYNTPAGGTELWTEPHTIDHDETGIFTALLGSATPLNIAFDEPYWLEVEIQGETLSPRYQMTSAPYALNIDALGGAGSTGNLECKIYSIDRSCKVFSHNTYTWADMFPDAKADGYEFKNCWPRSPLPGTGGEEYRIPNWLVMDCYQWSSCQSQIIYVGGSPKKGDTWNTQIIDCGKYASGRARGMDIICCKGEGEETGTPSEEKYCKRTSATYTGNLGGIAGADAKCQAEFGAGWSFVDTKEEVQRITNVDPSFYRDTFEASYDGKGGDEAWLGCCGSSDCLGWTTSAIGNDGTVLKIMENVGHEWDKDEVSCSGNIDTYPIWCCPS